jgi:hypothetical protein
VGPIRQQEDDGVDNYQRVIGVWCPPGSDACANG